MSRSHQNAYSQHHHAHQQSWFMSPNLVNSLFCSPGNNCSANCNNTLLNGTNINNHLTNLLNAQHHFISGNQHSSSSPSFISGSFSPHYHGNQLFSSMFPSHCSTSQSSNSRFIAGQNNHHYQGSSNYSRSSYSNRGGSRGINMNSLNSEFSHSRRYQSGFNSSSPVLNISGSFMHKSNTEYNIFNDIPVRQSSQNYFQPTSKESKSPNNNNNVPSSYNNHVSTKNCMKNQMNNNDGERNSNSSIKHSASAPVIHGSNKSPRVKGMENIILHNDGSQHFSYKHSTTHAPSSSSVTTTSSSGSNGNKQQHQQQQQQVTENSSSSSSKKVNEKNHDGHNKRHKFNNFDSSNNSSENAKNKNLNKHLQTDEYPKKCASGGGSSSKFGVTNPLVVEEEKVLFKDNEIITVNNKLKESGNESETSVNNNKKVVTEKPPPPPQDIDYVDLITLDEDYIENSDSSEFDLKFSKSKAIPNSSGQILVDPSGGTNPLMWSSSSISVANVRNNVNNLSKFNAYSHSMFQSFPGNNHSHFPTSTNSMMPSLPVPNIPGYAAQIPPNFPLNCPPVPNPGSSVFAAAYMAAAAANSSANPNTNSLNGAPPPPPVPSSSTKTSVHSHIQMPPPIISNTNAKCGIYRQENLSKTTYHDLCSSKLWQYYVTNRQTETMYVRKVQLRNALHMVMSYVFENAGLFIVGSSMNGFGSDNSDMDLCLTISSKELDQKKEAFVVLNQLVEPLRKCSFIKNLQLIRATVPILKFRDSLAGVDCDLNINNVVGIYNTHLLAMYNRIDWRVRPLGMYIKHWAQKLDLHDASRGRLSTYTLILMVIQYLQAGCNPPVLPSLQIKFPKQFSYERQVKEVDMRLELPWDELRSLNMSRLSDLLMGFYEYYSEKFDFSRMVISVRQGKPMPIDVAIKQLPAHEQLHNVKSFKMFIEEPFSLTNVARSLFDGLAFSRIKRALRHSLQVMRLRQSLKHILTLPVSSGSDNDTGGESNSEGGTATGQQSPNHDDDDDVTKILTVSETAGLNDLSEKSDAIKLTSHSKETTSTDCRNVSTEYEFEEDDLAVLDIKN